MFGIEDFNALSNTGYGNINNGAISNYGPLSRANLLIAQGGGGANDYVSQVGSGGGLAGGISGLDGLRLGIGGLQTMGNLWGAYQANKLAREQFEFTKGITKKNLANSIASYNTSLTDRITSRASANGLSQEEVDSYLKANRL